MLRNDENYGSSPFLNPGLHDKKLPHEALPPDLFHHPSSHSYSALLTQHWIYSVSSVFIWLVLRGTVLLTSPGVSQCCTEKLGQLKVTPAVLS